VGPTGRYLVDQNGVPFLWAGDAGWSLIAQPTLADAQAYLDDRKSRGFTIILVNLLEHKFSDHAPANHDGISPFTGRPFATPDERYFQHVDEVINQAAARGLNVLLDALYLGYQCGDEGWCKEVGQATTDEMKAWGKFLGQRYSSFNNLVWVIGGDTDPSPVRSNVLAFVNSLISYDSRHLLTSHNAEETTALSTWPNQSWVAINNVYSYSTKIYAPCQDAYKVSPVTPYFLMETDYENEHGLNAQQMRAEIYWPVLSGAMGVNFGNCPIWHFGSTKWTVNCGAADWKANLGGVGSENMHNLHRLLASRAWHTLVPDLGHTALTGGYGTDTSFAAAARASDGATLIAYLPDSRQVTVDMGQISGGAQGHANAFWYAPSNGAVTAIGTFPTSGTQRFTPPSAGDWVLVVDDASRGYPMPGAMAAASPPPTMARAATATSPAAGYTRSLGADYRDRQVRPQLLVPVGERRPICNLLRRVRTFEPCLLLLR